MYWKPPSESICEQSVANRLRASSNFYRFLWEIRSELFAGGFEEQLIAAYDPRGQAPCPPAMLAMVMLLQRYEGISDADAVDAAENDRRWQLVLGVLGEEKSPFGQGSLVRFRVRMIERDLDKAMLDRTVELAKSTGRFGWKALRVALDSSPLAGAGRVEDTWNLIGRAMARVVSAVATALDLDEDEVIHGARLNVLTADSVKAALDIDWDEDGAELEALHSLLAQVKRLEAWVKKRVGKKPTAPVEQALGMLRRIVSQDIEPDPGGGSRIREGVAPDRVISLGDVEMRHGRKSKSRTINGYKRHIAVANGIILATSLLPANVQEHEATASLLAAVEAHGEVVCLDIDRGYLASDEIGRLHERGVVINSRPWLIANKGFYTKQAFHLDLRKRVAVCPSGATANIRADGQAIFSPRDCTHCELHANCTPANNRSLQIHRNEGLLIQLRKRKATTAGRTELRKRVVVEHKLAHLGAIQGRRARYLGLRKNHLDLNRSACVANLHTLARIRRAA